MWTFLEFLIFIYMLETSGNDSPRTPQEALRRTQNLSRYCLGNDNELSQTTPCQLTDAMSMGRRLWNLIMGKAYPKNNLIPKRQKPQTVHGWANVAQMAARGCRFLLLPCTLPNYGVNAKFPPRANLIISGFFTYFLVYQVC